MKKLWKFAAGAALLAGIASLASCRTVHERRDPTGEPFPAVTGTSLDGRETALPGAFSGKPVVFLVGYEQSSQFDIDRWLLALSDAGVDVAVREVPTIPGMVPGLFSGWIDGGMRRGIPQEDWGAVVTVYGDGDRIARFTGNRDGLPGRVLLLDGAGRVAFFHDRGFSPGAFGKLRDALAAVR
ncbi:MAG: hypothetical protein HMLKMBBP_02958 [Planctomycetes bacterium]|nr:hypothetical protein [Planctomycetota bacterium]